MGPAEREQIIEQHDERLGLVANNAVTVRQQGTDEFRHHGFVNWGPVVAYNGEKVEYLLCFLSCN